ncbi:MAG: hypothetical protein ACJAQ6_000563 [Arenicella sp.]|jgi:hypothetical protein
MSDNEDSDVTPLRALKQGIEQVLTVVNKSNKHAAKRNRLARRQHRQSVLAYEQAERQYLIEKSNLQPSFRLLVTEFLTCEPDFVNDPEQASEAKYLAQLGVGVDQRVLRFKLGVSGDANYMRPSIVFSKKVFSKKDKAADQRAYSMTDLIYFVEVANVDVSDADGCLTIFLVYRDQTTLPVIHKYLLTPNHNLALPRWDAVHLDTVYTGSHKDSSSLNSSVACAEFFDIRDY